MIARIARAILRLALVALSVALGGPWGIPTLLAAPLSAATNTPVPTATQTPLPTATDTPAATPSSTATYTPSNTPSVTPSATPTATTTSAPITVTLTAQVASSSDDANQDGSTLALTSSTVWLGNGSSTTSSYTGLRFTSLTIPPGATINSARLQVYSSQSQWLSISMSMAAEAIGNSPTFSSS